MKSLNETSSGKLVSLISADMFQIERGLGFSPMVFGTVLVNFLSYIIIGVTYSWVYSGIVFAVWILTFFFQVMSGLCIKKLKDKEAKCTDKRLAYVADMVTGARTIKCYGWEEHYIKKIRDVRS